MPSKPFSLKARLRSFRYAFRGIRILLCNEHNAWIHLLAAFSVIIAGIALKISATEWIAIVAAIAIVLAAEAFNTAIEHLANFVSPDRHEQIGKVKDVAAGAVLITAIGAGIIGMIIFIPKILDIAL